MYPFMENRTGLALDTGVTYLRILAPFYFVVTDLILRVVLAIVLSRVIGSATGIWLAWPIGWTIATVMSLLFCVNGIKKLKREKTGRIE